MKQLVAEFWLPQKYYYAIALAIVLFNDFNGYSQVNERVQGGTVEVKGRLRDTLLNKNCSGVHISLMQKDSAIIQIAYSDLNGGFVFHGVNLGAYSLSVTDSAYYSFKKMVYVDHPINYDLGVLILNPKGDILKPVFVLPNTLIPRMRGDTLEFNTSNVLLNRNANVEELIDRLPGLRIGPNGEIYYNGIKIDRLLVDGEDFFGSNPTIATKNLNADMIAKIQILNKKSERAEFTGVNDGQTTKTLNLVLKEDSKKGYFVNGRASGDLQNYYNMSTVLGSFMGEQQLGILAVKANDGQAGWGGVEGSVSPTNSADPLGASAGTGIPQMLGTGIHYANKWNGTADHLSGNYQFGQVNTKPFSSDITQQILPDSIYVQQQKASSSNFLNQHLFTADYDVEANNLSSFRFSVGGSNTQENNRFSSSNSSSFNDTLTNSEARHISSEVSDQQFKGEVMWRIRSGKREQRTFSVTANFLKDINSTNGFLYSANNFYQPDGDLLNTDTIDEKKFFKTNSSTYTASLSYTEPLWKEAILALSHDLSFNRGESIVSSYDKGNGKYDIYIDSLSSHYQSDVLTQQTIANLQYNTKKIDYTIGGDLFQYSYKQSDLLKDTSLRFHYVNVSPRINIRWNINDYKSIEFDYNGKPLQPSISQIQPIPNNTDPLHIVIGNPSLRGSFSQNFSANFHFNKAKSVSIGVNYGFITNDISNKTYTDSLGRQISQAVNVNGSNTAGYNFSYGGKLRSSDIDYSFESRGSFAKNVNYLNQYLSQNENYDINNGLRITKYVQDKYTIQATSNVVYNYIHSTVNAAATTHYWAQSYSISLAYYPFSGFRIHSNFDYTWRQRLNNFDNHNETIYWIIGLRKEFSHAPWSIEWRLSDILNQNTGISRSISANVVSEHTSNVIGRYWMLTASYRFSHRRKK